MDVEMCSDKAKASCEKRFNTPISHNESMDAPAQNIQLKLLSTTVQVNIFLDPFFFNRYQNKVTIDQYRVSNSIFINK